jgi:hypothetical protein
MQRIRERWRFALAGGSSGLGPYGSCIAIRWAELFRADAVGPNRPCPSWLSIPF